MSLVGGEHMRRPEVVKHPINVYRTEVVKCSILVVHPAAVIERDLTQVE